MRRKQVAVFDFDYTLIDANSNNVLSKLVMQRELDEFKTRSPSLLELNRFKYSAEIERLGVEHKYDNTIRINAIYEYMHSRHGITRQNMESCLRQIDISDSMVRLIKYLRDKNYDLVIISDSNTFLIKTILKQNKLYQYFADEAGSTENIRRIFANPAKFDSSGQLRVKPLSESWNGLQEGGFECTRSAYCKRNICKGQVLERYIKQRYGDINEVKIMYVGDGRIDYCAGTRLKSTIDTFYVRSNFSLHKLIAQDEKCAKRVKARVCVWKSPDDILNDLNNSTSKSSLYIV